ncbi:MAG: carboxypeptidase regulatory-like domain-containing protein [Planctomycetota bacterium]
MTGQPLTRYWAILRLAGACLVLLILAGVGIRLWNSRVPGERDTSAGRHPFPPANPEDTGPTPAPAPDAGADRAIVESAPARRENLVTGLVLDDRGVAVVGARVTLVADPGPVALPRTSAYQTATDGAGRFAIGTACQDPLFALLVQKDGFYPARRRQLEAHDAGLVEIGTVVLEREHAVRGKVVDPWGEPVAAASVFADYDFGAELVVWRTATRHDGTFELEARNPEGDCTLWAFKEGLAPAGCRAVVDGEPALIRLARAQIVRGSVCDHDGHPIAGAEVALDLSLHQISSSEGEFPDDSPCRTRTAADGRFELNGLPSGNVHLRVRAERFLVTETELTVEDNVAGEARFTLEPLPSLRTIRGRVVDRVTGLPIEGATVRGRVRTDAAGRFELTEPDSVVVYGLSSEIGLRVKAEGYTERTVWFDCPEEDEDYPEIRIELRPSGVIRGLVLGPSGKPVEGARIRHCTESHADEETGELLGIEDVDITTDSDGLFSGEFPAGSYESLGVSHSGFPPVKLEGFEIGPAEVKELLVRLGAGLVIEGHVLREGSRELIMGIQVRVWRQHEQRWRPFVSTRTAWDGSFCVSGFESGSYWLTVKGESFAPEAMPIDLADKTGGAKDIELVVKAGESFWGEVVDVAGLPVVNARVTLYSEAPEPWKRFFILFETSTGADGGFRIDHLPAFPMRLTAKPPGSRQDLSPRAPELVSPPFTHIRLTLPARDSG